MKTIIPTLIKISAVVGMGIAPFTIIQGQVIETAKDIPPALAANTRAAAAAEKPGKAEKGEKKRVEKEAVKEKPKHTPQEQPGASQKPAEKKQAKVSPPKKGENNPRPPSKRPKDSIEDIARKAAEKSVKAPKETPIPVKPEPVKEAPRTAPEIAKKAAEKATEKPAKEEKIVRKPAPSQEQPNKAEPRMRIERETPEARLERERRMAAQEKGKSKGQRKPVARGSDPDEPSTRPPAQAKDEKAVAKSDPIPVAPVEEKKVVESTRKVEQEVNRKKMAIETPAEAQDIIRKVIGSDSELARSEKDRDQKARRFDESRERERGETRSRDDSTREAVVSYLLRRFQGKADLNDAPPSFRHGDRSEDFRRFDDDRRRGDSHRDRDGRHDRDHDRRFDDDHHHHHPIHNGRRHVQFRNRQDIPAILLAVSALNRVNVQNYREVDYLPPRQAEYPQMPREYREPESLVVSYEVDPNSMVSRDDILFQQGSTAFADEYSYEIVQELAEAMRDPSLANARFVIEGHASAEGGYEYNQMLSQRRAERIVRDIVRQGVSPDRLVPVGYGESESSYPANADERDRRFDRKVVVFRMNQ